MAYLFEIDVRDIINKYSKLDRLIFLLYMAYFILLPFYFWRSGLPQLSDIIFIILVFTYMVKKRMKLQFYLRSKSFMVTGLLFVTYIFFANSIWMLIIGESNTIGLASLYYIYNYVICLFLIFLYSEYSKKILMLTYKSIIISIGLQILLIFIRGGFTGRRMMLGFNNPNQLGYYALLCLSISIFISNTLNVKVKWFIFVLISCELLIFASLSSSAIISSLSLLFFYSLAKSNNKKLKIITVTIIIIIIMITTIFFMTSNILINNTIVKGLGNRAQGLVGKVSRFSTERGYYRITKYPKYWIFGAGEGEYLKRFGTRLEFHSTLGNIQVSYGIMGSFLFLLFLYFALKNSGSGFWYIIFSILMYGLTHNGIRNGLFWILLALINVVIHDSTTFSIKA